jgi:hypothetical protein
MRVATQTTESFDNDTLDQIRGVLCALSNRGESFCSPVSTLSIRFALARRNRELAPADHLKLLYSIGDVQSLPGGYWLPVPTTLVPLGQSSAIVISGAPTQTLEGQLGTVVSAPGYSRQIFRSSRHTTTHPHRTFASWCRTPMDTVEWTKHYLDHATFASQFVDEGFETFDHWSRRTNVRWIDKERRASVPDGAILSRMRTHVGTLYALFKFRRSRPIAYVEIEDRDTAWRLALGLRAIANSHAIFRVRRVSESKSTLSVTRFLPSEELTTLRALGTVQEEGATLSFTLHEPVVPTTVQMLLSLGLKQGTD